ncbi:MAG: ketopantoate reductase family protein [Clostridia bacterium]
MRYIIIGAGAIGGTVGAYMVRAGHDVLFVDNVKEHVDKINKDGLKIVGREEFTIHAPAVLPEQLDTELRGDPPEAILLCTKAQHTREALKPIIPYLNDKSYVVSMQNGLLEYIIADMIGEKRTVGSFVNFSADYHGPGLIMYGGLGAMYIGELNGQMSQRVLELTEVMRTSFLDNSTATDNIFGYLWGKMGYASQLFATAVVDETMADVYAMTKYRHVLANLAGEVVMVADAKGIKCYGFNGYNPDAYRFSNPRNWEAINESLDKLEAFNRVNLKTKSGIWRDLAVRKRRTEVDYQVNAVVKQGEDLGLKLPLNKLLVDIIHDLESGKRIMEIANLEDLYELDRKTYPTD